MRVQLELPELTEFPNGFPAHWMNIIFTKNRPDTYQIHAITTTYVRLVEAAMEDYRQARLRVHAVWIHRDPSSIPIGANNMASAYFEACLTNMHRAVRCMIKIRSRRDVPGDLKSLIPKKPLFTKGGKDGALRLSAPPNDASTIQINFWESKSKAYAGCTWIDKDPYD